jgi:hypothetical protein
MRICLRSNIEYYFIDRGDADFKSRSKADTGAL